MKLQTLKNEFEEEEALLKQLEEQAEAFNKEGKTEAGQRLEQQVTILKVFSSHCYCLQIS